jgi:pre-rRNA-processing protein IPI3
MLAGHFLIDFEVLREKLTTGSKVDILHRSFTTPQRKIEVIARGARLWSLRMIPILRCGTQSMQKPVGSPKSAAWHLPRRNLGVGFHLRLSSKTSLSSTTDAAREGDNVSIEMLTESFIAATLTSNKPSQHLSSSLKDVGIFAHEFQPQQVLRHGYKKSSVQPRCLAVSRSHIFAAQADKAVINVYSREKGNQEATVPFPDRIRSLAYADGPEILVIGAEEGKLLLWETATGRVSTSASSHLQGVSLLHITNGIILSGSEDATIFVWSLIQLVSFQTEDQPLGNDTASNAPLRAFSNHRSAIGALSAGHSRPNTNFAVSASTDQTCYIWHIETGEILRTILLPSVPTCIAMDPVDRVIYVGDTGGTLISVDMMALSSKTQSAESNTSDVPIQLTKDNKWQAASADLGSTYSLTLSYDGTQLLTGHANGAIVQWDVAKQRMTSEVINLSQPVTNIRMLRPEGFYDRHPRAFSISTVVKPKLEFNAIGNYGMSVVHPRYDFQAALTGSRRLADGDRSDDLKAMTSNGWPDSILDAAVNALSTGTVDSVPSVDALDAAKGVRLEEEVKDLQLQLAAVQAVEEKRNARRLDRMRRRDEVGAKRRAAYFAAKNNGKDGDAAMTVWDGEEAKIDAESDEEALQDKTDVNQHSM